MERYVNASPICNIKVLGVGGAGCNAVNRMIDAGLTGCEFIAINTDKQVLQLSKAQRTLVIGEKLTKGLGAGGNPEIGQKAAEESREQIEEILKGSDLVFVATGMGGGTGTGASPVIASISRQLGILTIAVVTKPFDFEGAHRILNADIGVSNLNKFVDSCVVVPNQKLIENATETTTMMKAFEMADDVLKQAVHSITDLIITPMQINLDFSDINNVMRGAGVAHMGVGRANGKDRLLQAIRQAVSSPMLETSINGATKLIISVKGGHDLNLLEVSNCGELVRQVVDQGCNIKMGVDLNAAFNDEVQVIIIATGFPRIGMNKQHLPAEQAPQPVMVQPTPEPPAPKSPPIDDTPPYLKKMQG